MAISKRKRPSLATRPDAEAFVRIIDDGLAEPAVVVAAYHQALGRWRASGGEEPSELVTERPLIDPGKPPSPEGRLILLHRHHTFKAANPQEES